MKAKARNKFGKRLLAGKDRKAVRMVRKHPGLAASIVGHLPALHVAAASGCGNAVGCMLDHGASAMALDADGNTALFPAALADNRLGALHLLLMGADPNAANHEGETPLHAAARCGNDGMVRLLLEHGADPHRQTVDGHTAMDLAIESHHDDVASALSEHCEGLIPQTEDSALDREAETMEWLTSMEPVDDVEVEPETCARHTRIRAKFTDCGWCGQPIMIGQPGLFINHELARVVWNGDMEREELEVDEGHFLLALCESCSGKLNVEALKQFLTDSPAARQ